MIIDLKQLYNVVGEKLALDFTVDKETLDSVKGYSFSRQIGRAHV